MLASVLGQASSLKVIIIKKVVSDDTEQDLVLAPASYCQLLQLNLADVLRRKASRNRNVRCDDSEAAVLVTERSKQDLKKSPRTLRLTRL